MAFNALAFIGTRAAIMYNTLSFPILHCHELITVVVGSVLTMVTVVDSRNDKTAKRIDAKRKSADAVYFWDTTPTAWITADYRLCLQIAVIH